MPAACQAEQQRPRRHGGQAAGGSQDQDAQPAVADGIRQRDKSQQALAQRFGVMSIPTVVVFVNGKEVERKVGAASFPDYCAMLDRVL